MSQDRRMSLTVVVTTYEWPEALDVVLRALWEQDDREFELIVADDGSGPRTAEVVDSWRDRFAGGIPHVWQEDLGFRKSRLENLAALHAQGDVLVFLDGDLLPRRQFVSAVRRALRPGWFLTSKRLNLSERLSQRVVQDAVPVWRWSALRWLLTQPRELFTSPRSRELNRPGVLLPIRDRRRPWRPDLPDFAPPYRAYCFFAVDREDLVRVNGFDGRFVGWGEEDVDMGLRLGRAGLRCGWPGPKATLLHLSHPDRLRRDNEALRRETEEEEDRFEAVDGLGELRSEIERKGFASMGTGTCPGGPAAK
jgi:glycosyltransferase involved in cell wall biosynthesis